MSETEIYSLLPIRNDAHHRVCSLRVDFSYSVSVNDLM